MPTTDQVQNPEIVWYLTKGNRRTAIAATLRKPSGDPVDLTGHTVAFRLIRNSDGTVILNDVAAVIDDVDDGEVHFDPPDTSAYQAGDYYAWFIPTRTSDLFKDRFPPEGKRFKVVVVESY